MVKAAEIVNQIVRVADCTPHPRNYNQHDPAQIADLRSSLHHFGQVRSIVVQATARSNGHKSWLTVAGHGLIEAAKLEGVNRLRADVIPAEWKPARVLAYLAADNELARRGNPDEAQLAALVAEVQRREGDELARLAAGDQKALDNLLRIANAENGMADAEPQIDRAAELNEKWQVKTGDLWRIGEHRLLCGDSTRREDVERLMGGDEAGLAMADPPYGIDASQMTMGDKESSKPKNARLSHGQEWDSSRPRIIDLLALAPRVCIWGAQYFCHQLPISDDWLCWHKKIKGVSFAEAELAWTNYGRRLRVLSHHWSGEEKQHITQKPLPVIQWAIEICPDSPELVYDPFVGSGTTLVACQNLQRKCRAIEISPNYCAVILERMATAFPGIEIERIEEYAKTEKHTAKARQNHSEQRKSARKEPGQSRQPKAV